MSADAGGGFTGGIFDVDGVLVDSPHEPAWREALRGLMEGEWSGIRDRTRWSPDAFTPQVYQRVMSGKPRMTGAREALDHFGVPGAAERAAVYAEHKQAMLIELIDAGRFEAYPDAVRFVLAVRAAGIRVAAASSSKNARLFLGRIPLDGPDRSLLDVFDVDVSGRDFAQGKPHPEIFLTAAGELGEPPARCFVVEDAASGIEAARAGGMGALGVARADDAALLTGAGAHLVVASLDEVDVDGLAGGRLLIRGA